MKSCWKQQKFLHWRSLHTKNWRAKGSDSYPLCVSDWTNDDWGTVNCKKYDNFVRKFSLKLSKLEPLKFWKVLHKIGVSLQAEELSDSRSLFFTELTNEISGLQKAMSRYMEFKAQSFPIVSNSLNVSRQREREITLIMLTVASIFIESPRSF